MAFSLCVVYRAGLSYDADLDLAGIVHALFNLTGDISGQLIGGVLVNLLRAYNDANLSPGLHRKRFLHPCKGIGDILQGLTSLDIQVDSLSAGTGSSGRDSIGRLYNGGFQRLGLGIGGM